jgi:hypothetical protein
MGQLLVVLFKGFHIPTILQLELIHWLSSTALRYSYDGSGISIAYLDEHKVGFIIIHNLYWSKNMKG